MSIFCVFFAEKPRDLKQHSAGLLWRIISFLRFDSVLRYQKKRYPAVPRAISSNAAQANGSGNAPVCFGMALILFLFLKKRPSRCLGARCMKNWSARADAPDCCNIDTNRHFYIVVVISKNRFARSRIVFLFIKTLPFLSLLFSI